MQPQGCVIWLTGLSGAGKTTVARKLAQDMPGSILLDGDDLRNVLGCENNGFDAASRKRLALTYARLAAMLARQGFAVIVATISLFHEVHAWNRANMPGYLEVFLDIPESVRRSRDPKGLYAAERAGKIGEMAGSGTAIELPLHPDLHITADYDLEAAIAAIKSRLAHRD